MKYQVGDEIVVLHSNEEGRVLEIMNEKMVMIEVRGVKFPAYLDQIDFPYFKRFTENKLFAAKQTIEKVKADQIPTNHIQKNNSKDADGVSLYIIPKFSLDDFNDEVVSGLKIYLSNCNKEGYHFEYEQQANGTTEFTIASSIAAHTDYFIQEIDFAKVNDGLQFFIEFGLSIPDKKKAAYFETTIKIKAKQLFAKIEKLKEADEPSILYPLFKNYPEKEQDNHIALDVLRNAGYKVYDVSHIKQHIPAARSVIDLHIEKIVDRYNHLNNAEILAIQIAEFEKWFELAQLNHLPSLTIIHGVGKGVLRTEIHELLKLKAGVKHFVHQYSDLYGYGATEVFFQ